MRLATLTLLILLSIAGCKTATNRGETNLSAVNAANLPERRPSIKSVPAASHGNPKAWRNQRNAMLEAAAQLVTIYADSDIYFLARDGEYLYDLAVTLNPKAKNLKLINVSRDNLMSHKLLDYLAQEGLSEKSLQSGKLAVLVDSGFSGSIPNYIYEKFSAKAGASLFTHLLCSESSDYPSSRVFLRELDPSRDVSNPSDFHNKVVEYEHVSHWETKAATFEEYTSAGQKKLRAATNPMNHPYYQQQQSYRRKEAFELMQSIKYFGSNPETKKRYAERVAFWQGVKKASATSTAALNQYFKNALEKAPTISERAFIVAASYDARDMAEAGAIESLVSEATIARLRKSMLADKATLDFPYDRAAEFLSKGSYDKFFELLKEGGPITQESKRALYDMIRTNKTGAKGATKLLGTILKDYPEFIHPLVEASSEPSTPLHSKILVSATDIAIKNNDTALAANIAESVFNSLSLKESMVESTIDRILDHIFKKKNLTSDWREVIDVIIGTELSDRDSSVYTETVGKISTWVAKQSKPDVLQASKLIAILAKVDGVDELELKQIADLVSASKKLKGKAATHYLESLAKSSKKNQPGLFSMTEIMRSASTMTNTAQRNQFITKEIAIQLKSKFETPVSRPIYDGSIGDIAITLPDTGALVIESYAKTDRFGRDLIVLKDKNGFNYSLFFENSSTGKFIKNDLSTYESLEKAGVPVTRPIHSGSNFYIVDKDLAETDLVQFLRQDFEKFNVSDAEKVNDLRVFFERLLKSGIKLNLLHPSDVIWNGEEWSIITTASVPKKIKSSDKLADIYSSLVDAKWRPELVINTYANGQYQQRSLGCSYLVQLLARGL